MWICCFLFLLGACTPFVNNHGYNYEKFDLKQIVIGQDTKDTVLEKMGSPSSEAVFVVDPKAGGSQWLYMTKKTSTRAFFKPDTTEQHCIIIEFDNQDRVTRVDTLDGESIVPINPDETESKGYETSVVRDVFGNFGRYSGKKPTPNTGPQSS